MLVLAPTRRPSAEIQGVSPYQLLTTIEAEVLFTVRTRRARAVCQWRQDYTDGEEGMHNDAERSR